MAEHVAAGRGVAIPGLMVWPLCLVGLIGLLAGAYFLGQSQHAPRVLAVGPRIEDVRRIAKLAVLRVQVADVIEGRTAGALAAVLVRGDADLTVDLDRIRFVQRDEHARTATLAMPTPRAERPRVDQERTRIYELRKTGLAAINPFADPRADLLADAMRAAQEDVQRAVQDAEFIAKAKEQAELLVCSFYREMGWSVTIQWE